MSNLLKLASWSEFDVLDIPTLKARIAAGANLRETIERIAGMPTPLGVASYYGNVEACRVLLAAGADPLIGRQGMVSPLVVAIEGRQSTKKATGERRFSKEVMIEVMRALIEGGANPDGLSELADPSGKKIREVQAKKSPIYTALQSGDQPAAIALIELGADTEIKIGDNAGSHRKTALQIASEAHSGWDRLVTAMIKAGADASCLISEDGETPFQVCVRRGHVEAVEYYVRELGEDLTQRVGGRTMLQWAKTKEMRTLLNSLKTELAVENSLDSQASGEENRPAKKLPGMVL